jgi:hypothetical protein
MSRGEGGGAPLGNKYGVKLKDPAMRQRAYKAYCEWRAKGKSKRSFRFQEGKCKCIWETLESYLKDEDEFDPIHMKYAEAEGFGHWEQIVEDSATGVNEKANTASLQMIMRNKYSWDKESKSQENHKADVAELAKGLRSEPLSETEISD